jgi:hypothetical protein
VGRSIYPLHAADLGTLMATANAAMHRAKRSAHRER